MRENVDGRAQVDLVREEGLQWYRGEGGWVKGYSFTDGRWCTGKDLVAYLFDEAGEDGPSARARNANGCFAAVKHCAGTTFAVVDRVRSIPLFYSEIGGRLHISDDADLLRLRAGDDSIDEIAASSFLLTGYVHGSRTLTPSVGQLEACEMLTWDGIESKKSFYDHHAHGPYESRSDAVAFSTLTRISERVFGRLVRSLGGRTAVVPLSGGYDSRYIVSMLKLLDYRNVICFTYGRGNSFEVENAKKVARALGVPWYFIEYDREVMQRFFRSDDVRSYEKYACNNTSLPHVQEYSALHALRERDLIDKSCVLVPGFCGDLLGGSYVPAEIALGKGEQLLAEGITDYIFRTHFHLRNDVAQEMEKLLKAEITTSLSKYPAIREVADFVSLNEAWFTCEKVAKFVVNAVRVYEHFGCEWRLPLWDTELTAFWYASPVKDRIHSRLYDTFLERQIFDRLGVNFNKNWPLAKTRLALTLRRSLPRGMVESLKSLYGLLSGIERGDVNAFDDLYELYVEDLGPTRKKKHGRSVNQAAALWYLERIRRELADSVLFTE